MDIPLEKRLRRRLHVEIGRLQDEVVEAAYALDGGLVFHGGTAIWRCFSGNRFSEDLDFYCSGISIIPLRTKSVRRLCPARGAGAISDGLEAALSSRALELVKFKRTGNLIFAKVKGGEAEVRLEVNFSSAKRGAAARYERMNGSRMDVLCLTAGELVLEKVAAYRDRRFVRDLYDIYHLSEGMEGDAAVRKAVAGMLRDFRPPLDAKNLPALIYSGAAPSVAQMELALRRRFG
jgi:predicted nucleotidyltransferase component of viral defense system